MAKRRRGGGKFIALPVEQTNALSTLGDKIVKAASLTGFDSTKFRCVAVDLYWALQGATPTEGPLEVGIANGDLSVTEIGEMLDANPTSQSDIVALEQIKRPVRRSGQFPVQAANEVIADGRKVRTKLHTILDTGIELVFWVRNNSGGALTTGAVVECTGTIYGYWI